MTSRGAGMNPGTVIGGRYRIVRLLGRGGMGTVYEVNDLQTDRARALKLMLDHKVEDPAARARFEREARIAGRINSPFVVDMIDAGVDAETGTPYIVMELLEGENLDQRLTRLGRRPAMEVVEYLAQVARALTHMHANRVVHRDLKPSNLFVEARHGVPPRIKVLDLGVAKVLSASGGDTTAIVGSMPYMAPEQLRGRAVGPAADLYAFGLIAFTLLAGSPYWTQGRDQPPIALAMRISAGPEHTASTRARELGVELPPAFDLWFARATARQPGKRFRSAVEAVRALAGALGGALPGWDPGEPEPAALGPDVDALDESSPRAAFVEATESSSQLVRGEASTVLDRRSASRRRRTRRRGTMLSLVAISCAALAVWSMWLQPGSARIADRGSALVAHPGGSPLAAPGSVLACPILEVDGNVADLGWLGAAAGSLACERARVILGGLASRTRAPAELLDLRQDLAIDDEPYGSDDARARSVAAARRADAYLDGSVSRLGSGDLAPRFRVALVLRRADGTEVRAASGEGRAAYEAVRDAMTGLIVPDAIPTAHEPDPTVADYARARDIATMLHLVDLKLAMLNNAGSLETECNWFADADGATDLASFVRYACRYTFGDPTQPVVLPSPTTRGARVARARVAHMANLGDDPTAISELPVVYSSEPSSWGKSVIAATLSCLLEASKPDQARVWGWRAVEDEPKNPTGEWCGPWGQLMSVADDTSRTGEASVKWRVWAPWESYAWWFAARNTRNIERALIYAERAYLLSPLDTNIATELSNTLLRLGKTSWIESIANRLGDSRHPVHQILNRLLTVRFDASEGRFGRALATAREAMQPQPDDAGWVRAERLEIAWRAIEIANVLGRASELADLAVAEFIDPKPAVLDWGSLDTPRLITAICAYASPQVARRCFSRLNELKPPLTAFAAGARRFAAGDYRGAAEAWRALVRDADEHVDLVAEAMVRAFTAAGEYDLAIQIEARTRPSAPLFDGANMAMAQAAQAAYARGDRGEASRLAKLVLAAWTTADVKPPILDRMKQIAR